MDPRVQQPFDVTPGGKLQPRSANHSPLMAALTKASLGEKVNFCPFGCKDEDLDENGYCDHLVGFTDDGKSFEPQVKDERGQRHVQGGRGEPVLKTDRLERITTSSRVYRESAGRPADPANVEAGLAEAANRARAKAKSA